MNGLEVNLTCECGQALMATPKNAGGVIQCRCGRSVQVPRLSALRQIAGSDAYATNPADVIRQKVARGDSPGSSCCIACGSPTATLYECLAICESSFAKSKGTSDSIDFVTAFTRLAAFVLLPLTIFVHRKPQDADVCGHDVEVRFPFRLCDPCKANHPNLSRSSSIKSLLARVDDYQRLIQYYPDVRFTITQVAGR
jgi:hypothetical protein